MRVSGKPRLPRSRRSPKSTSVVCISHTSAFSNFLIPSLRLSIHKTLWPIFMGCPFPGVWHLCLSAWSYGGSVAIRLATCRRSRFCVYETLSVFRCLFVPSQVHYLLLARESVPSTRIRVWVLRIHLSKMRFPASSCWTWYDGCGHHRTGPGVQQLSSFTMHTGLAEQRDTCLLSFSALGACYSRH